ncbi:MAG: hypothetical protein KH230_13735 [Enterocloster asparagiformis]|nr:hypothetical protein [Enterocloster asparagiformis]
MREIRYRARALADGKWRILTFNNSMLDALKISSDYDEEEFLDMNTLGESTGKYDISGKEIFEGDIIESHLGGKILADNMVVRYGTYQAHCPVDRQDMDSVGFYIAASGLPDMPVGPMEDYAKVIGNIHENPDLLNPLN